MVTDERKAELEPMAVMVCQQLHSGYAIDTIKNQFDDIAGADPHEILWALEEGKQRYVGYYDFRKQSNRADSNTPILIGVGLLVMVLFILGSFGWSTAGRHNGKAIIAIIAGVGAVGYGVWIRISAEFDGRRRDLGQL
jgi:hypothetical protein